MARPNRKKRPQGLGFPLPLAAAVVAVAALAVVYVCLHARTEGLGREIKELENRRDKLRQRLLKEQTAWAQMQSPASIECALRERGLVMTWPAAEQIVLVSARGVGRGLVARDRRSAAAAGYARVVMND